MPLHFTFLILAFNVVANHATRVAFILYALKLGAQPVVVGLLAATFAIFPTLLSLQAGKVIDRLGSRLPLMLGALSSACVMLLPYFHASLPVLFAAAAINGLGAMFCGLSSQNLIGGYSTTANRTRNFNNASLVVAAASAAGPLIAGFAIDRLGHAATFLCILALLAAPVMLLAIWGGILPGGKRRAESSRGALQMLKNPLVWPLFAASSLSQSGLDLFQIYVPVHGVSHGLSASQIGVVLAMTGVGGFAARILLIKLISWSSEEKLLAYALIVGAAGFAAAPFFSSAPVLACISFIFGLGMNCAQPITLSLIYTRSPQGRAAEALGLRLAMDNGARLVSPGIYGAIANAFGVSAVFWINALVLGCGGMLSRYGADKVGRSGSRSDSS